MTEFKDVIIGSITNKQFDRSYYLQVIATWQVYGWLTAEEAAVVMTKLDEVLPAATE